MGGPGLAPSLRGSGSLEEERRCCRGSMVASILQEKKVSEIYFNLGNEEKQFASSLI